MRTEYRNDPTVDTADLPYGWHKGDTCVMITNKAKKSTSEYIVESYDGVYFGVRSHTGLSADAGPVLPVLLQIHLWFLSLALLQTLCQIRDGVFDLCS